MLEGWLVVLGIALVVCALGWYSADNNNPENTLRNDSSSESSSEIVNTDEYASALQEGSDYIESTNSCTNDAFDSFDNGYFDAGMSIPWITTEPTPFLNRTNSYAKYAVCI